MPELPEVETVKETLKPKIINKKILNVDIYYPNIIYNGETEEFKNKIINQKINDIKRRGKWLLFELDNYYLLSHLRMEGKYNLKTKSQNIEKHEHVIFTFENEEQLRYKDTRKFGKMHLVEKEMIYNVEPLSLIGLEPWDLTLEYLSKKILIKNKPIKTLLLDQSIIAGIGNIYADEILFLCNLHPETKGLCLTESDIINIIENTKKTLEKAILEGGTTIRTYESSEGVHGRFQQDLLVHNKKDNNCIICNDIIKKIIVGQRGTYYCPTCQKNNKNQ